MCNPLCSVTNNSASSLAFEGAAGLLGGSLFLNSALKVCSVCLCMSEA